MSQLSRGKLVRDSSLLPPVGSKELNSSSWALWQTSLPTEPSCCPPPSAFCRGWEGYRVSLYSPVCPGTRYVDQAGLKLTEFCLLLAAECWECALVCPLPHLVF